MQPLLRFFSCMPKIIKGKPLPHVVIVDTNIVWHKDKTPPVNPEFDAFWTEQQRLVDLELKIPDVVRGELLFQHVAGKTIACWSIHVKEPQARIEPKGSHGQAGFGLDHRIEVVQHRVRGVGGKSRRSRQRRFTGIESTPMVRHSGKVAFREGDW